MHRILVTVLLAAFVAFAVGLTACQTGGEQQGLDRADIVQAIDGGELAVNLALGFAEVRGTDTTHAREASNLAFDLARDVLAVRLENTDPESLTVALEGIKAVVADVLRICKAAGVSEARIELLETSAEGVYAVLERVIATLPEKTAYVSGTCAFADMDGHFRVASDRPSTCRGPRWLLVANRV